MLYKWLGICFLKKYPVRDEFDKKAIKQSCSVWKFFKMCPLCEIIF